MARKSETKRVTFSADFETTTNPDDCRVWLWGVVDIDDTDFMSWGIDIESFINFISTRASVTYFHNLKFDGHFIMDWLLRNGYDHVIIDRTSSLGKKQFKTLISDTNKVYSIEVRWETGHSTEFRDSLKKLPMTVKRVAKSFNLPESKGEIDYHAERAPGYMPTPEELDYQHKDVLIVGKAISQIIDNGMTRLTVGADSIAEYKRLFGAKTFRVAFPVLDQDIDADIRKAYRGGFTYADERFMGEIQGSGLVLDVNSLYPSVMYRELLPYDVPVFEPGEVVPDKNYPLVISSITFTAKLKPNHIPCIQIKGSSIFGATEYLREVVEPVTLMVTNIDLELYKEQYDMNILSYNGGWKFKGAHGMFDTYIEKWAEIKENSTGGQREIAKLHLNSLYGKFASNPNVTGKIPVLDENRLRYVRGPEEFKEPVYTAAGVYITSYARALTIRSAQANYDVFAYADTDSLHLLTDEVPDSIEVDPVKMGAWKLEYRFKRARFVRPKVYLEEKYDGEFKVAFAGLPENVSSALTFDDLVDGRVFHGKLRPRSVPGGVVLEDETFTLKM